MKICAGIRISLELYESASKYSQNVSCTLHVCFIRNGIQIQSEYIESTLTAVRLRLDCCSNITSCRN